MSSQETIPEAQQYVAAIRVTSSVQIKQDEPLIIRDWMTEYGRIDLTFYTRWLERGFDAPIPGDLLIEIRGPAPSVKDAVNSFANAALGFLPVLVLSANAPIEQLEVELAFEASPGEHERQFFQNFLLEEPVVPQRQGRLLDVPATVALLRALDTHPDTERLRRAMNHYALALDYWRFGQELLAVEFLYMGMEVLVEVAVREHCRRKKVSETELAESFGIEHQTYECGRCAQREWSQWQYEFKSAVRRMLLFQGDVECFDAARKASDGLEHGYRRFAVIRPQARAVRDRTAVYLRSTILDLMNVGDEVRQELLCPPFDQPVGPWPITAYLWGTLVGPADRLAAEGQKYPFVRRETSIAAASRTEKGRVDITIKESITAVLGDGVQLRDLEREVWGPTPPNL